MEIVRVKNDAYGRYEEALHRRDNLLKEAELYNYGYIREFGDLIQKSFELKIECIKKKKEIAYCQRMANQGKKINRYDLVDFIEKEMYAYYKELAGIVEDVAASKKSRKLSPAKIKKIKEIYYRLAKLIHPDLHPDLAGDEVISEYWRRIMIAYTHNMLDELEELEFMVKTYLDENGIRPSDVEIPDIEGKIRAVEEEIHEILTTVPYLYKLILSDEVSIGEQKQEYLNEIEAYREYSKQLSEVLDTFDIEEMLS
jgi:septation ring formation regulator EzrA